LTIGKPDQVDRKFSCDATKARPIAHEIEPKVLLGHPSSHRSFRLAAPFHFPDTEKAKNENNDEEIPHAMDRS